MPPKHHVNPLPSNHHPQEQCKQNMPVSLCPSRKGLRADSSTSFTNRRGKVCLLLPSLWHLESFRPKYPSGRQRSPSCGRVPPPFTITRLQPGGDGTGRALGAQNLGATGVPLAPLDPPQLPGHPHHLPRCWEIWLQLRPQAHLPPLYRWDAGFIF